MSKRAIIFLLIATFTVAVGLAMWSVLGRGDAAKLAATATGDTSLKIDAPRPIEPLRVGEIVRDRIKTNKALNYLTPQDREQIAQRTSEALHLYDGGSFDEFREWIRSQELPPSYWIGDDETKNISEWKRSQEMTATGQYEVDAISILLRQKKGLKAQKLENLGNYSTYPRLQANTVLKGAEVDISRPSAELVEVVVPTTFINKSGQSFKARLGLLFGRNDAKGKWVLVAATCYDKLAGPLPPLRV